MDLSLYLIDLLAQHGEITVPGLGRFFNTRASAYYNEAEGKFYPPHNTVSYDQQYDHDIRFAQHIAAKKGISVASAGFFIDKYVDGLLQEVAVNDAKITDLGWLRYDGIKLTFKPETVNNNDPAFFGLPAFEINKFGQEYIQQPLIATTSSPQLTETSSATTDKNEPVFESADLTASSPQQQYFQEEEYVYEEKRRFNIWVIIAITLIVLGAAAIGIYYYKPSLLGLDEKNQTLNTRIDSSLNDTAIRKKPTHVNDVVVADDNSTTVIQGETGVINTDTTVIPETKTQIIDGAPAAKETPVADNRIRQEVQAGAYNTEKRAIQSLSIFTGRGLEAKVVKGNKRYIITLGTFYKYEDARAFQKELIAAKKIKKNETIIKEYPPTKK
ncbi:MAG: hypothetical protein EOP46_08700 [Sphingobacteriaceae bacterium]|nr:MAG: hypothetical protein EOP46_08700 [Sphingobacteriaceae bacterium]